VTRWLLVCMALVLGAGARAAEPPADASDETTTANENAPGKPDGLPLPRFVSLRASSVNLRVGPNARYPIEWIYVRRNLPVEVIAEFDTWRRIKDPAGTEGWVHSSMLSGRRTAVVTGDVRPLRRTMDEAGEVVASLEAGVIVEVQRCPENTPFCRVAAQGLQGWIRRDQLWGVYPDEAVK
jgi:SH3-like domain-containing protein